MKITRLFITVTYCIFLFCSSLCHADDSGRSKIGFDIKGFKANPQNNIGWLVGGRWAGYFGTSQVYMGLATYFGAPTGLNIQQEKMYYGGLIFGVDKKVSKWGAFEANLLLGYGEGELKRFGINERSHYVVEPGFGFGASLGGGWRLTFAASYLHMANATHISGPTFGFRFALRSGSSSKAAND
ncbi:MAG: hypothetical protein HQ462_01460 [Deltaproteobacteria bacterium]|nr:hypothetical protein [Deltaproteobacteria bacterium]